MRQDIKELKLTKVQEEAYSKLTDEWQPSYRIGFKTTTLDVLVRRGLADYKAPKYGGIWDSTQYRLKQDTLTYQSALDKYESLSDKEKVEKLMSAIGYMEMNNGRTIYQCIALAMGCAVKDL